MQGEDFGEISEREVCDAVLRGQIIARYPDDRPYPSCLIYGRTSENRPLHIVSAYTSDDDLAVVITVYQPNADLWIDFERRKRQ